MDLKSRLKSKTQSTMKDHLTTKRQETPTILSESRNKPIPTTSSTNKILSGVIACLDVRTDDGSDCSLNFERALQSMGAKTRKTFSDSVTHLVFKNGSPATLKKALGKKVFIINCLWVSQCKREGKRLPEKEFIIEKPQGLAITGKRKRKSMEPGKVKALGELEPSTSTSSEEGSTSQPQQDTIKFTTPSLPIWKSKKRATMSESEIRRRQIAEAEAEEEDGEPAAAARLSLPVKLDRLEDKKKPVHNIPVHAPSTEKQEQIKARFSIGQVVESEKAARLSTSLSSPNTSSPPLLKRKRRLTGNLSRPPLFSSSSTASSSSRK